MIAAGDYIRTWRNTGCFGVEPFYARVIRVNRKTVTVKDENGAVNTVKRVAQSFAEDSRIGTDDWHTEIDAATKPTEQG